MNTERDILNQIAYAREKGEEAGMAKDKAEGIAEAKLQMANDLKANGVSLEIIAKCTGLSVEEIEAL